jgi:2-dehydropantoate 2-reductase
VPVVPPRDARRRGTRTTEVGLRILVVGAGAIGGLFGGRLVQAGRDVTFLVRPQRASIIERDGLWIRSPLGDLNLKPQLLSAEDIRQPFDVIVLSVKAYSLASALDTIGKAVGTQTMILPLLNGMQHMDLLQQRFARNVVGGICRAVVQLNEEGEIEQRTGLQQIAYGELDGSASSRITALDATLQGAGLDATLSSHIVQDMWDKWLQLASLGAATCLLRGTIGEIAAQPYGPALSTALLECCTNIARACGHPPSDAYLTSTHAAMTQQGAPTTTSMYRDLLAGHPVEADQILGDLIRRGSAAGVDCRLLQAAFVALRIHQSRLATH